MKYFLVCSFLLLHCITTAQIEIDETAIDKASMANNGKLPEAFINNNIILKAHASKLNAFVGEPILVTYKFYTRIVSQSKVIKMPTFSGCSVQEMTTDDLVPEIEVLNGKKYKVHTIRKVQLIPLHVGTILLDTAAIENIFTVYDKNVTQQQINAKQAFSHDQIHISYSKPVTIVVKELPNNTLLNFTDAIGNFNIQATLLKSTDTANENNQLKITVSGSGNFSNVTCPTILWPLACKSFEISSTESIDQLAFPNTGTKEFIIPFITEKEGEYTIPPILFTYFDADSNSFKTIETLPLKLEVLPQLASIIDESKLQKDITNKKYFWIVPVIALLAAIGWWIKFGRKKNTSTLTNKEQNHYASKETFILPETSIEINAEPLENYIHNSTEFFSKAKNKAESFLNSNKYTHQEIILKQIIAQCNAALYAGDESIDKLQLIEDLKFVEMN